jgi:hypothetical protein
MTDDAKWMDINKQGSGSQPCSTDAPTNSDAQTAIDRATRASELHQEANRLADRSGK